jgi:hypothetical protein
VQLPLMAQGPRPLTRLQVLLQAESDMLQAEY